MTSEDSLKERITQMSTEVQGGPNLQRALEQGRARRRRRTIAAIGSGVATACVIGVVAGAVFAGVGTSDGEQEAVPATAPEDVPQAIKRAVREQLPANAEITATEVAAYPSGSSRANPPKLPRDQWDQAGSWLVRFELGSGEFIRVTLTDFHENDVPDSEVRSECEKDPNCSYTELDDGVPAPMRTEGMVRIGKTKWIVGADPDVADRDKVWTRRALKVHLDGSYQVGVVDAVHVPTRGEAESAWTLDPETMLAIATDEDVLAGVDGG